MDGSPYHGLRWGPDRRSDFPFEFRPYAGLYRVLRLQDRCRRPFGAEGVMPSMTQNCHLGERFPAGRRRRPPAHPRPVPRSGSCGGDGSGRAAPDVVRHGSSRHHVAHVARGARPQVGPHGTRHGSGTQAVRSPPNAGAAAGTSTTGRTKTAVKMSPRTVSRTGSNRCWAT